MVCTVEETFEEKSREMLERKDGMLRKYRLLLMEESMVREGGGREDDDIYKAI